MPELSRVVITGDKTQIDLPNKRDSGLLEVEAILDLTMTSGGLMATPSVSSAAVNSQLRPLAEVSF